MLPKGEAGKDGHAAGIHNLTLVRSEQEQVLILHRETGPVVYPTDTHH